MMSNIGTIFNLNHNPHARLLLLMLYLEKVCQFKLLFRLFRVLITQGIYHVELAPESIDSEAIATLLLPHPYNIIVHPKARIGNNCILFQGVTIGARGGGENDRLPRIGNNVLIGCNSVIIGDVNVGNDVQIGAMSIIIHDVSSNSKIIGRH